MASSQSLRPMEWAPSDRVSSPAVRPASSRRDDGSGPSGSGGDVRGEDEARERRSSPTPSPGRCPTRPERSSRTRALASANRPRSACALRVGQPALDQLGDAPRPGTPWVGRRPHLMTRLATHRRGSLGRSGSGTTWFGRPAASQGSTGMAPLPGSIAEGGCGIFAVSTSNRWSGEMHRAGHPRRAGTTRCGDRRRRGHPGAAGSSSRRAGGSHCWPGCRPGRPGSGGLMTPRRAPPDLGL